jgi:ligand-binding sensor domain-containing protein
MRHTFFIFCFLLLQIALSAQQQLFTNERIGNVIPSHECYNVFQDHRGYIWFSTEGGLCRYDGVSIKVYNEKKGLREKTCYGISESSIGKLWFITSKNRVLYYDENKDSLCEAEFSKKIKDFFKEYYTEQLYLVMAEGDSTLLFCSQWMTISVNVITNKLEKLQASDNISYYFKKQSKSLLPLKYRYEHINFPFVGNSKISIDINNEKFIIDWENKQVPQWRCITAMNSKNECFIGWDNKLIKINSKHQAEVYNTPNNILSLYIDKDDGLWVGVLKSGVLFFENSNLTNPISSIPGISVTGICEDHEKGIWCSTLERGIYFCKDKRIISYANLYGNCKTEELLKFINGSLYCNVNNNKMIVISNNSVKEFPFEMFGGYGVMDIVPYHNGFLVASSGSIAYVDPTFNKENYFKEKNKNSLIGASDIYISPTGKVFLLQFGLLLELNEKSEIIRILPNLKSGANCFLGTENEILLGCKDGLYKFSLIDHQQEKIKGIEDVVSSIIQTKKGFIYIATKNAGIYLIKDKKLQKLTNETNLKDVRFFDLCSDHCGSVYAASNIGLIKFNESDFKQFTIYSSENGLPSNQVNKVSCGNGKIFISTVDGLCSFPLYEDLTNKNSPQIYLNHIFSNEKEIVIKEPLFFKYNENNIRIELDALTYKESNGATVIYTLKGLDYKYYKIDTLKGNSIFFENLSPNTYELTVFALNNNGFRSNIPAHLTFIIEKAFWQTMWFALLYTLLFLLVIFFLIRKIVKRIKLKEEDKTRTNKMIAEYQLTALQAQMNPHFIFNAINSIQGYILKKNEQQAYDYLAKFSKLIRMVLNNSQENLLSLKQELEMLQLYVELEQLRFDNIFEFELQVDNNVNEYEIQLPSMLIQPYVENAIWHGLMNLEKNKKGKLLVHITTYNTILKITIEDNGIGRKLAKTYSKQSGHTSVGMNLTEQRLTMINKLQNFESAKVNVIDLCDENKEPVGTRVEIYINAII